MVDTKKTKAQLIAELAKLRHQLAQVKRKQQQTEKKLQETQEQFELFMEHLPAAVFIKDQDQELVYANQQFAEIVSNDPQDVIDQPADNFTPDAVLAQFEEENRIVLSTGQTLKVESTFPTPLGPTHWLTYKFPIYKEERPAFVAGISLEITARKQTEIALRESETRYRLLVENTSDLVCEVDATGKFTFVSPQYEQCLGYRPAELLGREAKTLIHPDDLIVSSPKFQWLITEMEASRDEWRFKHKEGEWRWLECAAQPYELKPGDVRVVVISRDITQRRQMEKALRQANTDLHRRLEELTTLNLIAQTLTIVTDLTEVLNIATTTITWLFHAFGTGISLFDPDQTEVTVFAHYHRGQTSQEMVELKLPVPAASLIHQILEKGQSIIVPDYRPDPWLDKMREIMDIPNSYPLMLVPLVVHRKVIGLIEIVIDQPDRTLGRTEIALAETIAGQVANAIEVARLFEEERHQRQIAESLREVATILNTSLDLETVLAKIFEQLDRVIDCHGGGVFLQNEENLVLWAGSGESAKPHVGEYIPLTSQNPGAQVFNNGKLLTINRAADEPHWMDWDKYPQIQAWIGVPLFAGQEIIGVLTVDNFDPGTAYRTEDAQILQTFANQAALAIHNARLYEQVSHDAKTKAELLKEVNHRVRNNLMAINGLILAEKRYVPAEGPAVKALERLNQRMHGLIQVHNILSQAEWAPVSLAVLVREIIKVVLSAWPSYHHVQVAVASTPIEVSPRQASNLVLVINELVTNTLKHVLPTLAEDDESAQITVRFGLAGSWINLEYRDNGDGYPDSVLASDHNQQDGQSRSHIGLHLIRQIVSRTLGGTVKITNDHGAVARIRFKSETEELSEG